MKRNNWLLALLAILILIAGCNPEASAPQPGKLKVFIVDSSSRSLESNVSLETASYEIVAEPEAAGLEAVTVPVGLNEEVKILTLIPGSWNVKVWALNANGTRIGVGEAVVAIEPNVEKSCSIGIEECSGLGTFNLCIRGVYESNRITASIYRNASDKAPMALDLHKAAGTYYATEKLDSGSYLLYVYRNDMLIRTDAIRIVADGQTNADVLVSEDNMITIKQGLDVDANTLTSSDIVGGFVENGNSYKIHSEQPAMWFVDGVAVEGAPSNDFTWTPGGFALDSIHEIAAVTGNDSFRILSLIKVKIGGIPAIRPVVKNDHVIAGDEIQIAFENIPDVPSVEFDVDFGGSISGGWISRDSNILEMPIPSDIQTGETDVVFTVTDGSSIKIDKLHLVVGAYVPADPIAMEINTVSYIGDGLRISFAKPLPVSMNADVTIGGIECGGFLRKGETTGLIEISGFEPGTYECTIKLSNGRSEIPTTGNTCTLEIKKYDMPSISFSAGAPVCAEERIEIHLSEALPVSIGTSVFCNERELGYIYFNPGETVDTLWIPSDFAVGKYMLSFNCWYDGQKVVIPDLEITVKEFEVPSMVFTTSKYICNDGSSPLVLENPAMKDVFAIFNLVIDDVPLPYSLHKQVGDDFIEVYPGNLANGRHTITGTATVREKEVAITPVAFDSIKADLKYDINTNYVGNVVDYEISRQLVNTEGLDEFVGAVTTVHVSDNAEVDETLTLGDGNTVWSYHGNKPALVFTFDVTSADGSTLLLRKRDSMNTFKAEILGPKYITLQQGGTYAAEYTASLNRNDIDWGPHFEYEWYLDNEWLNSDSNILWDSNMAGRHSLELFINTGSSSINVARSEIFVEVENIDASIDLDITSIRRNPFEQQRGYEFEIESSEPMSHKNLLVSIVMDDMDLSSYFYYYESDDPYHIKGGIDIPAEVSFGSRLHIDARLLGADKTVIQKDSMEYEIQDLYLRTWEEYRMPITGSVGFELVGCKPNESFSYYDGDTKLDLTGETHGWVDEDNSGYVELETLGFGPHSLVAVSDSDTNRRSEVLNWYTGSGVDMNWDSLNGSPAANLNCHITLSKDPADNLPEAVEYSLWYEYPGQKRVTMPSNATGEFAVPVDVKDLFRINIGYEAVCGGKSYSDYWNNIRLDNCEMSGLPETIVKGSSEEYTLSLNWYNDLITYDNYDFIWYINGKQVGTGRTITLALPSDKNIYVKCRILNKQDGLILSSVGVNVPVK